MLGLAFDRRLIPWLGYFVLNHASLAGHQTLFGQLWKEYALSDSRYLTSDPFMISVETITVVRISFLDLPSPLYSGEENTVNPTQLTETESSSGDPSPSTQRSASQGTAPSATLCR